MYFVTVDAVIVDVVDEGGSEQKSKGRLHLRFLRLFLRLRLRHCPTASFAFLARSRITYVITPKKNLGGGTVADGETDAKNASVDGP
jgi:hypothetical protein